MSLQRDDVAKVALLARLQLTETELQTMTAQLARIVAYVEQLGELETDQVEPLAHVMPLENVLVADEPHDSLPRDLALANAPKRDAECYRVPAVLGD